MKKVKSVSFVPGRRWRDERCHLGCGGCGNCEIGQFAPRARLTVLVTATACIGVFLGGLSAALFSGEKGALLGGACGLLAACVVAAGSLVVYQGAFTISGGARLAAIFLTGALRYLGRKPQAKGEILTEGNHTFCRVAYLCALDFVRET